MERDGFSRRGPQASLTAPLGQGRAGGTSSLDPGGSQVPRALRMLENLEQRVELLAHAAEEAELKVPGGTLASFYHEITQKGRQFIAYIVHAVEGQPRLARAVPISIYRFREVGTAVGWRTPEQGREPADQLAFKRQVFSLANIGAELGVDPVLKQLFPEKASVPEGPATAPLTGKLTQRQRETRKGALDAARSMVRRLEPRLKLVEQVLADSERGAIAALTGLLGQGNDALLRLKLGMVLRDAPEAVALLRQAIEQHKKLGELLAVEDDAVDTDEARKLAFALGRLPQALARWGALRAYLA